MIFGGITFQVTKELIVEVIGLATDEERDFRSHILAGIDVPFFLKDELVFMGLEVLVKGRMAPSPADYLVILHLRRTLQSC